MENNSDVGSPQLRALFRLYGFCAAVLAPLGISLGYEAECGRCSAQNGIRGAVFRAEPGFVRAASYVNGTEVRECGFTVALRTGDADTASRYAAEECALLLCAALRGEGGAGTDGGTDAGGNGLSFAEEGVLLYGITPVSVPARLRLVPDGAIWEVRFSYRMTLTPVQPEAGPSGGN